jgi:hypothetical protein
MPMPGSVHDENKGAQFGTGMLRYWTPDAGMPIPSYVKDTHFVVNFSLLISDSKRGKLKLNLCGLRVRY